MRWKKRPALLLLILALCICTGRGPLLPSAVADDSPQYRELELFTDVLSIIRTNYVEEVPVKDLIYGAINGMLATLDPHSAFMPPDLYKERRIDTSGEFGGLGIEITIRDGLLLVVSPIEDTPAFRAGIAAGDLIVKIEDKFTKGLNIMDAVKMMRGKPGTEVTITIMRDSFDKPRPFTLAREKIQVQSVKARMLEEGYGYIRLSQFQERTANDLQAALKKQRQQNGGSLAGLILDLRNNPGGLLDQAVSVSDAFLGEGLIVYTEGRSADSKMSFSASADGTEPDYPMVILINSGSASASEIVAGALQDHGRAIVLGTQSFGKGSVQSLIPMGDDSGLSLTTARYYTPSGTSIQATGITPDILVKQVVLSEGEEDHPLREKDLENHFDVQGSQPDQDAADKPDKAALEEDARKDYQLMRALDLLKGWEVFKQLSPAAA